MNAADLLRVGSVGLRTRRLRAALSALGIAIGIASMVAVLGISASSQANLLATIDRLGTNLLTAKPGESVFGEPAVLPPTAPAGVDLLHDVDGVAAVYALPDVEVQRNEHVDEINGITVAAADRALPRVLEATLRSGRFLVGTYPTVVLGAVAAKRLGISSLAGSPRVYLDRRWSAVVGILDPVTLDSAIDRTALIGVPAPKPDPTTLYVRAADDKVTEVRSLLAPAANPEHPEEVDVSRPSDALEAKAAAEGAFTSLLLGLGAVALLVGGVGIANVMVISVLERRSEIGLRRALGATRRHIATQFLTESVLLAAAGGVAGAALGALTTAVSSAVQDQPVVVPPAAIAGGIAAALAIGALAGLYPALRAARLSPTQALQAA